MPEPRRDLLQRRRHLERMRAAFQHAGTGDQRKRQAIAEVSFSDCHDRTWSEFKGFIHGRTMGRQSLCVNA